jgi:hypothetical protein
MNDVAAIDPIRSARLGEQIPTASERLRLQRKGVEHINVNGHLEVPLASSWDRPPVRKGWEPFFVAVNLDAKPQKWVIYRRPKT